MATSLYRGTVALSAALLGPPDNVTALALTCWDTRFTLHGIQPLPTPIPDTVLPPLTDRSIATDVGTVHAGIDGGGHGHSRLFWSFGFEPTLPEEARALTLSATAKGTTRETTVPLPRWPATVVDAPTRPAASPAASGPLERAAEDGPDLPDRVLPVSADMGVAAGVRRVATHLYCWPSWFLLTVEASGAPTSAQGLPQDPWELEDDRGGHYHGALTGAWDGLDTGVHVACAPGLEPLASELRVTFTDPFGSDGRLTTTLPVPPNQG